MALSEIQMVKAGIIIVGIMILSIVEIVMPRFRQRERRLRHAATNLSLWMVNVAIVSAVFSSLFLPLDSVVRVHVQGILGLLALSPLITMVLAVLVLDVLSYATHIALHKIGFLWRFHRVHHSDKDLSFSTGFRFHVIEQLFLLFSLLLILPFLGIELWHFFLYEFLLIPLLMMQHANLDYSGTGGELLRLIFATPAVHHTHHSMKKGERDSNYGSIFSIWDKIFNTYTSPARVRDLKPGLQECSGAPWETLMGLVLQPFKRTGFAGQEKAIRKGL